MKTDAFDFELPPERIALHPAEPREAARLLEIASDELVDHVVGDLPSLLRPDDILVFNDTRVIPAALTAPAAVARPRRASRQTCTNGSMRAAGALSCDLRES